MSNYLKPKDFFDLIMDNRDKIVVFIDNDMVYTQSKEEYEYDEDDPLSHSVDFGPDQLFSLLLTRLNIEWEPV